MPSQDYKIVEEREENGTVLYQKVRFYTGAITTEDEIDVISREVVPVTKYRRAAVIQEEENNYKKYE